MYMMSLYRQLVTRLNACTQSTYKVAMINSESMPYYLMEAILYASREKFKESQ